jgi:hypothetical protein
MEYSVKSDLPYVMMDGPGPFDTVEMLEQHLAGLQAMPDFVLKAEKIEMVQQMIAQSKRLEAGEKTQE